MGQRGKRPCGFRGLVSRETSQYIRDGKLIRAFLFSFISDCMQSAIQQLNQTIEPLRQQIIHHPVYGAIRTIEDLQVFMQSHVFAVWDFMSLLKALQNNLTCTTVPWFPQGDPDSRYLINEIVLGEETDVDALGHRKSHYELYLDAMHQSGADTQTIATFLKALRQTGNLETAMNEANVSQSIRAFVNFTFRVIGQGKDYVQAAVFTFGREDLIPNMFLSIVNDLKSRFPETISIFSYYLERHIEVDGDHHSHLALQMTANLCGNNPARWQEAEAAVVEALQQRIQLWNGVYQCITGQPVSA